MAWSPASSRPIRCRRMARSSSTTPSWRRAASACFCNGPRPRRTSRKRSLSRSRLPSVASSRRSAFSRRLRYFKTPAASSMMARRSSGREFSTESIWPCPTITCCWRPMPLSESSSWISNNRHGAPLIAYSESPLRNSVRVIVTSENSIGNRFAALSIVSETSARPSAGRSEVPAKMTSSIFPPRNERGPWAPSTHATASTKLDLPDPFGPTTTMTPGSNSRTVLSANDLKPRKVRDFRNTPQLLCDCGPSVRAVSPDSADAPPEEPPSADKSPQQETPTRTPNSRHHDAGVARAARPAGPRAEAASSSDLHLAIGTEEGGPAGDLFAHDLPATPQTRLAVPGVDLVMGLVATELAEQIDVLLVRE